MNRPQRVRSPPFSYESRAIGRTEQRPIPPDFDDTYGSTPPFDANPNGLAFAEPPSTGQFPLSYRDHRQPPASYRSTLIREPYPLTGVAQYKILCITNLNPKISDGPMKDALISDFSRFGDISVSICHDSGERLAYIYFRTYEEAREARHTKARTILFDRPIEIEPIFEPRTSPLGSPSATANLPVGYSRRRSITPPDYYGIQGAHPTPPPPLVPPPPSTSEHTSQSGRKPVQQAPQSIHQLSGYPHHQRAISPPPGYSTHPMRYPGGGFSPPLAPHAPYSRHYLPSEYLPHPSPYSSPPHEQYRYYQQIPHSPIHTEHFPPSHPHPSAYPPYPLYPRDRERERGTGDSHIARSPRGEVYPYPIEHRAYPPPIPHHVSRTSSSYLQNSNLSPSHPATPNHHQQLSQSSSSSSKKSPPHFDHPVRYMSREYRREKYSSESYLNEPEEGRPSRLIFVTNIDTSKSEDEIRDIFEPYGVIEELELRKVSNDYSSALIKYSSMDCAYKAKTALGGKYLGNIKCRITYGKVSASRRLWIGGLGSATTMVNLDDEFGKYGNIINLDYISGRPYAYVEFESANQAQFATQHLRGSMAANADRRMRIEYVDPVERNDRQLKLDTDAQTMDNSSRSRATPESRIQGSREDVSVSRKRLASPSDSYNAKRVLSLTPKDNGSDGFQEQRGFSRLLPSSQHDSRGSTEDNGCTISINGSGARGGDIVGSSLYPKQNVDEGANFEKCVCAKEIADGCSISWPAKLVLRNFNFPAKMFLCSGRKSTIEKYIVRLDDTRCDSCPTLKITQRWRLHPQPKLEEVKRRMQTGNLGMVIMLSRPNDSVAALQSPDVVELKSSVAEGDLVGRQEENDQNNGSTPKEINIGENSGNTGVLNPPSSPQTQSRPLKNLISYLEQKDAAGVISLAPIDNSETSTPSESSPKLLYTFPPGSFAFNLLKRRATNLSLDLVAKEEFLLGVIVGGSETKI